MAGTCNQRNLNKMSKQSTSVYIEDHDALEKAYRLFQDGIYAIHREESYELIPYATRASDLTNMLKAEIRRRGI